MANGSAEVIFIEGKWGNWNENVAAITAGIEQLIAREHKLILVGKEMLGIEVLGNRRLPPFLERDGQYWGAPADSLTAIREVERMRQAGVSFLVFSWMSFWWLLHDVGLTSH
jgi:hypothetical protein